MKSFTLSTAFIALTIIALAVSNFVAWRDATRARSELQRLRDAEGVIVSGDPGKTYVRRFVHDDYRIDSPSGPHTAESFRLTPAVGAKYVLHLTEVVSPAFSRPTADELTPTVSVVLDEWRPGAVLSCAVVRGGQAPQVLVEADSARVMEYESPDAWGTVMGTTESWMGLGLEQGEYPRDQRVRMYWWYADNAKRGFMLWLEPYEAWRQRNPDAGGEGQSVP